MCATPAARGSGTRAVARFLETLESVSSCTRFSVPMFVFKDFVLDCFIAQICANSGAHAHFGAYLRTWRTKSFSTNIGTYIPKNMPTNFELKRLKPFEKT